MKLAFDHALETYIPTLEEKKDTQMLPKFDREQQTKWEKQMLRDLKKSQIIWLAYRESACGAPFAGGLLPPSGGVRGRPEGGGEPDFRYHRRAA